MSETRKTKQLMEPGKLHDGLLEAMVRGGEGGILTAKKIVDNYNDARKDKPGERLHTTYGIQRVKELHAMGLIKAVRDAGPINTAAYTLTRDGRLRLAKRGKAGKA